MDLQIENIKEIMDSLDLAALFPELQSVLDWAMLFCRWAMLAGPVIMLVFGLIYWFLAPKEATYSAGYRFRWGMGSPRAWAFMQKLAGIAWTAVGGVMTIVMLIIVLTSGELALDALLWKAVWSLAIQAAVMLLTCLVINIVVLLRYDLKGQKRSSWLALIGL